MTDTSGRFAMPWLQPGQAQKEMLHNEALAIVDAALHPAVEAVGANTPPGARVVGQGWVVGPAPTGDWAGRAHALAAWTEGGWRFVAPVPGMAAWSVADGLEARWTGSAWTVGEMVAAKIVIGGVQVVGARRPAIPAAAGGTTVDAEARTALAAVIAALSAHGLIAP